MTGTLFEEGCRSEILFIDERWRLTFLPEMVINGGGQINIVGWQSFYTDIT